MNIFTAYVIKRQSCHTGFSQNQLKLTVKCLVTEREKDLELKPDFVETLEEWTASLSESKVGRLLEFALT